MAAENGILDYSFNASASLKSYQYHYVKPGITDGNILLVSSGNDAHVLGVLQNDATTGEEAVVRLEGITKLVMGEDVRPGDILTSKSNAHAERADADGEPVNAICLSTHSSTGETGTALITHFTCYATSRQ